MNLISWMILLLNRFVSFRVGLIVGGHQLSVMSFMRIDWKVQNLIIHCSAFTVTPFAIFFVVVEWKPQIRLFANSNNSNLNQNSVLLCRARNARVSIWTVGNDEKRRHIKLWLTKENFSLFMFRCWNGGKSLSHVLCSPTNSYTKRREQANR